MKTGMVLGYLSLANPLWLWGFLAAVGVPLLVHLLSRRAGRTVVFPAMRFIQQAIAERQRWRRPQQWLIMLLRVGVLALIVAAFARPVWYAKTPPVWAQDGVVAALVLDRSASMTRPHHGASLLGHARRQVIQTLRRLDPRQDLATVILLDAMPTTLLPGASANFSQLIKLVEQTQPTYQRGDLDAALRLAADASIRAANPADKGQPRRTARIELYSDMQATQDIDGLLGIGVDLGEPSFLGVGLRTHRVGHDTPNLALSNPTLSPVRPIVGQPAVVTASVSNFTDTDTSTRVVVQMAYEDQTQSAAVVVGPGQTQAVSFAFAPVRSGPAFVSLRIDEGQSFDPDDRTGLCFTVADARRVAMVTDADRNDPQSAAFYFARALQPDPLDHESARIDLTHWPVSELSPRLITGDSTSPPDAVVLAEAGRLGAQALGALYRYLADGGAVIWGIDSSEAAASLSRFGKLDPEIAISPVIPRDESPWVTQSNKQIQSGQFDDPLLTIFEGPARAAFMRLRFGSIMAGQLATSAVALLRDDDGWPALACRWIGAGRLAVFSADLSPGNSDWVKGPLFVPLLHQLVRGLTPGRPVPVITRPGDNPVVVIDDAKQSNGRLVAYGPDGQPVRFTVSAPDEDHHAVQLEPASQIGRYTVAHRETGAVLGGAYVGLDPAESDLRAASPSPQTAAVDPSRQAGTAPLAGTSLGPTPLRPDTTELWPYLIVMAVGFMGLEVWLAHRPTQGNSNPLKGVPSHA